MYKLPERGGGVIRAMPERKHSFFWEVFPYIWRHVFILGKDMRIVQDTCVHVGQGCVHCARTHVFMLSKDVFLVQGCGCSC